MSILSAVADSACRPGKADVWWTRSARGASARLISTRQSAVEKIRARRIEHAKVKKFVKISTFVYVECYNSVSITKYRLCGHVSPTV